MTVGNMMLFVDIASNEGTTNKAIATRLDISTRTVSKQLSVLRDNGKINGEPLIYEEQSIIDKRIKMFYLTDKGKEVAKIYRRLV